VSIYTGIKSNKLSGDTPEMQDEKNHELNQNQYFLDSFEVTQNLTAALRHIRLPDASRIMWIDAIRIDQSSAPERNHQVAQMRGVYLSSRRTLLWLGEEKDPAIGIKFLHQMPLQENGYGSYIWNPDDELKWVACDDLFFKRPHWGRSWILQEVLHNRNVFVYIGLQNLTIEELLALFKKYFGLRKAMTSIIINDLTEDERHLGNTPLREKGLAMDRWFRSVGAEESMPDSLVVMDPEFKDP
jgi:hypothetical protein